jgi:tRNA-Thr(GGU) m(6)t(6)A37 methyltransferase TsaA
MKEITFRPIGVIRTPFTKNEGTPIQPPGGRDVRGTIELNPAFVEGLADLQGFSHIILLYHFHHAAETSLKVVPFLDTEPRGVFATRAPNRPNPLGLSVVRLVKIEGNRITISDVDILDGTPLLDIKPYIPDFDSRGTCRIGWIKGKSNQADSKKADNRFR